MKPGYQTFLLGNVKSNQNFIKSSVISMIQDDSHEGPPTSSQTHANSGDGHDDHESHVEENDAVVPPNYLPPLVCISNPWQCNCSRVCQCIFDDEPQLTEVVLTEREKDENFTPSFKCSCKRTQCDCTVDGDCGAPFKGDYMLNFENGFLVADYSSLYNFVDTTPFTLEAWIQFPVSKNLTEIKCLMSRFNYGKAGQFRWWLKGDKLHFQRETTDDISRMLVSPSLPTDTWIHTAIVYTGKTLVLLINGIVVSMVRSFEAYEDTTTPFVIGACMAQDQYTRPWKGVIDDVRVWSVARTQAQIQERMYQRLKPQNEILDGLIGYWRCNLGTGRVVADVSLSKQHATIRGKVTWEKSFIPITDRQDAASKFSFQAEAVECGVPSACQPTGNIAIGKTASQSSTYHPAWAADRAVAGYTSGMPGQCTHTLYDYEPWLKIDLGTKAQVIRVRLLNRADCCGSRLNNVAIYIGDIESSWKDNTLCAQAGAVCVGANCWVELTCAGTVSGRYVYVVLPGKQEYLTVCAVEVYGPDFGPYACSDKTPRIGAGTIPAWSSGTACTKILFDPPFASDAVMVQATVSHRDQKSENRPHNGLVHWIEDISRYSFTACARELTQYGAGAHSQLNIEWLAYLDKSIPGAQTGEVAFSSFVGVACQMIVFSPPFRTVPYFQATTNHRYTMMVHDASTLWVEEITSSYARVCVRETAHDDTGSHDGNLRVSWLAFEQGAPILSQDLLVSTGAFELPAFKNKDNGDSPCFYLDGYKTDLVDAPDQIHIIVTINHHKSSGVIHEALTVWVEEITATRARVCLRALSRLGQPGGNKEGQHPELVVDYIVFSKKPPQPRFIKWFPGPTTEMSAAQTCQNLGTFWGRCSYEQLVTAHELGYRKCSWSRFAKPNWDVAVCKDCGFYKKRPGECAGEILRTTSRPSDQSGVFCCHLSCE
eukprot:c17482_g1_i1.p1 GENE.c17482_g1_i1~~c17482_g1_i1.p1  ORF type:complete len:972 (+),score=393.43 c17482_g1_i1:107-2917(+)